MKLHPENYFARKNSFIVQVIEGEKMFSVLNLDSIK